MSGCVFLNSAGNFCAGAKIFNFSSEIIFGQLLWTFGDFLWSHWRCVSTDRRIKAENRIGARSLYFKNHVTWTITKKAFFEINI